MDKNFTKIVDPLKLHKKQMWLRVYLPLILVSLIVIGAATLLVLQSSNNSEISQTWSAMALTMMIAPFTILSIFLLVVLVFAVIGMSKANRAVPPVLRTAANKINNVNNKSQHVVSSLATPVIKIQAVFAGVRGLFSGFTKKVRRS